jgi:hypothetical protein
VPTPKRWTRAFVVHSDRHLAFLAFALGAFVLPAQAQTQKPLEFNGMVFEPPPAQAYQGQAYEAPQATPRSAAHARKQHHSQSTSH